MAYNPALYNPYNITYPWEKPVINTPSQQQASNGLTFIDKLSELDSYTMPPGSISQPYFLRNSDHYAVKIFDLNGGSSVKLYEFKEVPLSTLSDPNHDTVTKADLEQFKEEIMEVINGKHIMAAKPTEASKPIASWTSQYKGLGE